MKINDKVKIKKGRNNQHEGQVGTIVEVIEKHFTDGSSLYKIAGLEKSKVAFLPDPVIGFNENDIETIEDETEENETEENENVVVKNDNDEEIKDEEDDSIIAQYETEDEIYWAEKGIKLLRKQKPSLMYDAEASIIRFNDGKIKIDISRSINQNAVTRLGDMLDRYVRKHLAE